MAAGDIYTVTGPNEALSKLTFQEQDDGSLALLISPLGTVTIGTVAQGNAGSHPWPVADAGLHQTTLHQVTNSADMTTAADVSPAPGAGNTFVITDLVISVGTTMNVTLTEEDAEGTLGGPYYLAANSTIHIRPRGKGASTANTGKRVQATASVAGHVTVEIWGYTED